MARLRRTLNDRLLTGSIVSAAWLGSLALSSLLMSPAGLRVATRAPAPPAAPSEAPVETLPPTLVVAGRDDVSPPDCRPGERGLNDGRCVDSPARPDRHSARRSRVPWGV